MTLLAQSGQERSMAVMQRLRWRPPGSEEEKGKEIQHLPDALPDCRPQASSSPGPSQVRCAGCGTRKWSRSGSAVRPDRRRSSSAISTRSGHRPWSSIPFWESRVTDVLQFYLIITLIAAFHELGHAYPMKICGGDAPQHRAGAVLLPPRLLHGHDRFGALREQVAASLGDDGRDLHRTLHLRARDRPLGGELSRHRSSTTSRTRG